MRRIVARAHRVDVVRLHQLDVAPHHLLGDRPPGQRVELVPVDAVELHPVPVDLQQPVLDHHPAEADRQQHALAGARHHAVVEPRDLGAPRLDALDDHGLAARGVDAQLGHGDPHVGARRIDAQPALARHVVEVGVHEHVLDRSLRRPRLEPDLTEDPRHPPHVLVLEIRARRPLVHAHREHVRLTRAQRLADRELDRQPAPARGADVVAVDPRAQAGVDALEAQDQRRVPPMTRARRSARGSRRSGSRRARTAARPGTDSGRSCTPARRSRAAASATAPAGGPSRCRRSRARRSPRGRRRARRAGTPTRR